MDTAGFQRCPKITFPKSSYLNVGYGTTIDKFRGVVKDKFAPRPLVLLIQLGATGLVNFRMLHQPGSMSERGSVFACDCALLNFLVVMVESCARTVNRGVPGIFTNLMHNKTSCVV